MTLAYNNKSTSGHGTDGQTDRRTDGQSDSIIMRHPPTEERRIIIMFGYERVNGNVLRPRVTARMSRDGRSFQMLAPETGNARLPTVERRTAGRYIKPVLCRRPQPSSRIHVGDAAETRLYVAGWLSASDWLERLVLTDRDVKTYSSTRWAVVTIDVKKNVFTFFIQGTFFTFLNVFFLFCQRFWLLKTFIENTIWNHFRNNGNK